MKQSKQKFKLKQSVFITLILVLLTKGISHAQVHANLESPINQPENTHVSIPLQGRAMIIDVTSERLDYSFDKNQFVATGSAEVYIKEQNTRLQADIITFDQKNQIVIAENNVRITKEGNLVLGSYAKIYLDRESALINDPATFVQGVRIRSKTSNILSNEMEAFNGTAYIDALDQTPYKLTASEFKNWLEKETLNDKDRKSRAKIISKEIDVDCLPDRNVITLKNATIFAKNYKIAKIPKIVFTTDKDAKNIETMLPEIGQNPAMGLYFGPSHVFFMPHGATFKVSPLASFASGSDASMIGGGLMSRYMSENNETELGFTTNKNKVMLRGEQRLTPETKLVYGTNSFIENGFFGNCISKYVAEIVDNRKMASMLNFDFNLRSSAGYSQDYYSNMGTMKFQLQGELSNPNPLYSFHDELFQLRTLTQGNVSVYGTGNTYNFIRTGPWMTSKLGRVTLNGAYLQSAMYGSSPFLYDQFLPGKSNVIMGEDIKINNRLNVGHYGSYNLLKDNWEHKLFAENIIYAKIGPDDLKFNLSYDLSRKFSRITVDFLLGKNTSTKIDFDKLKVNKVEKK